MKLNTGDRYDISEKIINAFGVKETTAKVVALSGGIATLQIGTETFHLKEEIAINNLTKSYNLSAHFEDEPKKKSNPKPVVEPVKPVVEPVKPVVEPAKPILVVEPVRPAPIIESVKTVTEPVKPIVESPVKPVTEPIKPSPVVEPIEPIKPATITIKPEPIVVKPAEKVETIVTPKQDNTKPATKPATVVVKPPMENPDEGFI